LAGEEGVALAARLRAELAPPQLLSFSRWVCVRARWVEDIVEAAVAQGVRQYVVLGAGLDSFAYRRGDLLDRLRVFEVDHPASQAWKRHRLAQLDVTLPGNLVFAAVDFEQEALVDGLTRAGFDFGQRAVFSWIGVTMYLSLDAIQETLSTVNRCPAGTRLVLTYNLPRAELDTKGAQFAALLAPMTADLGEPMISLFTPKQIEQLLREHNFDEIVHFGPNEAAATYFRLDDDVWLHGIQRLIAASVS